MGEQVNLFYDFFEQDYHKDLVKQASKGQKFLKVDFGLLSKFNPEMAELLLEKPEDTIRAAELAVANFDIEADTKNFKVRFFNLPHSQRIPIRDIRSDHINKLLEFEGLVRQKSDVRPQVMSARFECPTCGNVINVLQTEVTFKEPTRCSCGRKGKFKLLSRELVDAQRIVIEEAAEDLDGGEQPKRFAIFLKSDLVSPMSDKKSNPGSKVRVNGIIKDFPIDQHGVKTNKLDLYLETMFFEPVQEDFYELAISPEEEAKIRAIADDPRCFDRLRESLAPSIYGHTQVKEAILLQMCGGVSKKRSKGDVTRGDIHVLLVGDPGSGKSQILKRVGAVAPKSKYVSGKGASGTGLTAAVVKDEFLKGWALEAGTLVLANKGICCTTGDAEFITEDLKKIRFDELFDGMPDEIHPKFKVLAYNENSKKIEPFKIKRAFKIKNDKRIFKIVTKTGREIKLTEDNEILIMKDSKEQWIEACELKKGVHIAVPRILPGEGRDAYNLEFAYVCGLVATDGHIKHNNKQAQVSFYNTNQSLISAYTAALTQLNVTYNTYVQKSGRISELNGLQIISRQDLHQVYNSRKAFAVALMDFGIPEGNKSIITPLNNKILGYSLPNLASFMRGVLDGDGSVRKNPIEITLTTGIYSNARLFQEILLRFGIVASVKKSTRSWHCDVRGAVECAKFFEIIGATHPEKIQRLKEIAINEPKNSVDILPNSQDFFKHILKKHRGKLGKSMYKYFWNYTKKDVCPPIDKLKILNDILQDDELSLKINTDVLWDEVIKIEQIYEDYVYDFTMDGTNNFVANNIIMHNCIDELDKMSKEDQVAMHEALEQQTISIAKANIQATLKAETTVLAAANPRLGRFDPYELIAKQIELPPTILNRFDLIFTIRDLPSEKGDRELANFLLKLHQSEEVHIEVADQIDTDTMKRYLSYARRLRPKLSDAAFKEIQDFYVKMRNVEGQEGKIKAIPVSARQLEALIRLSEASAKIELRDKVLKRDARRAIDLLTYSLMQVGMDPQTGKIDIDTLTTGITASQRNQVSTVREIINELEKVFGKQIPMEDIERECEIRGVDKDKTNEILDKLRKSGDIFSPKHGIISKIE